MLKQLITHGDRPYVRYGLVSVCALGADVGIFMALLAGGMIASLASGLGYSVGIAAHWLLSSRLVFQGETHRRGTAARRQQKVLFAASAVLGLGLTMGIVGLATTFGLDPRMAKVIAIGVSFQAVWLVRRIYVFAR
ncbi:GtrA family protein [Pacificimonas sp. WHA3]|uniref:GtrA family protein n=1 Tax=Pacificimonas pallii TaxID=2827236 RepID=A0ABS6SCD3_9SPHN|nr:GtrA family protein [Pacificimonas pallii]MBV7256064.1 GtrA family protein [Pacificimonas pallii]